MWTISEPQIQPLNLYENVRTFTPAPPRPDTYADAMLPAYARRSRGRGNGRSLSQFIEERRAAFRKAREVA